MPIPIPNVLLPRAPKKATSSPIRVQNTSTALMNSLLIDIGKIPILANDTAETVLEKVRLTIQRHNEIAASKGFVFFTDLELGASLGKDGIAKVGTSYSFLDRNFSFEAEIGGVDIQALIDYAQGKVTPEMEAGPFTASYSVDVPNEEVSVSLGATVNGPWPFLEFSGEYKLLVAPISTYISEHVLKRAKSIADDIGYQIPSTAKLQAELETAFKASFLSTSEHRAKSGTVDAFDTAAFMIAKKAKAEIAAGRATYNTNITIDPFGGNNLIRAMVLENGYVQITTSYMAGNEVYTREYLLDSRGLAIRTRGTRTDGTYTTWLDVDGDGTYEANTTENNKIQKQYDDSFKKFTQPHCFAAGTSIRMADGDLKNIEDIEVGDLVLAFDADENGGRGHMVSGKVVRLFQTDDADVVNFGGMTVTSGHVFLNELGQFEKLSDIAARGGSVVRENGEPEAVGSISDLGPVTSATVYNFEVEHLHTYIAGGYRVHNDSRLDYFVDGLVKIDFSELMSSIGSVLGNYLGGNDPLARIVVSAGLTTILTNIGLAIDNDPFEPASFDLSDLGDQFVSQLGSEIQGAISSYIVGEAIAAIGLEGPVGELVTSAGTVAVSQIVTNVLNAGQTVWVASGQIVAEGTPGAIQTTRTWNTGINPLMFYSAFASWLGSNLADQFIQFDTVGGQIGAAIGAAYGSIHGAAMFAKYAADHFLRAGFANQAAFMAANPMLLVAYVVAYVFLFKILGGVIGTILNGTPKSWARAMWNSETQEFSLSYARAQNGASAELAGQMASSVASSLNSILAMTGATVLDGQSVNLGEYGQRKSKYLIWDSNPRVESKDVSSIINFGTYRSLGDMSDNLGGGDAFAKRALISSLAVMAGGTYDATGTPTRFTLEALASDIQVGLDYGRYVDNYGTIDQEIATEPTSVFAMGWLATLARAGELGLNKRNRSDWLGGWNLALDEAADGYVDGYGYSAGNLFTNYEKDRRSRSYLFVTNEGEVAAVGYDTVLGRDKDAISGTATANTITVTGSTISSTTGLTINGASPAGSTFQIKVAALIDAAAGNDTVKGGDLGNDLFGGDGNDILAGGLLDDWIFGEAGDDLLFSGNSSNMTTAGTDATSVNLAVQAEGGNGNYLSGGDGNDRIYGSKESDWLSGDAGGDLLYGGTGGDIIQLGAGTDQGANGTAAGFGGAGADQYVFAYGDGIDVIYDGENLTTYDTTTNIYNRVAGIANNTVTRTWAGGGSYMSNGDIVGGEDAISFGFGVTAADIIMYRASGTDDLVIKLTALTNPANPNSRAETGDVLTVKNWFLDGSRIEWLRFADGQDIRIGDISNFVIANGANNLVIGSFGADFIYGGAGDDIIYGLSGNDFGNGGEDNDFVAGDADNDFVMGGTGDDKVMGGAGLDMVMGDQGQDWVSGDDGDDIVSGGVGNDTVIGGSGKDVFAYKRGDGQDEIMDDLADNWQTVRINQTYQQNYELQNNGTVTYNGAVVYDGSEWIGTYRYDATNLTLKRWLGPIAGVGNTARDVNLANMEDLVQFDVSIDIQDLIFQKNGNALIVAIGTSENDTRLFSKIDDRITVVDYFSTRNIEYFVFAATGMQSLDTTNIVASSDGADVLIGSTGVDWITGGSGNDSMNAMGGADIVAGGAGDDTVLGGSENDVIYGGAGDDILNGESGSDTLFGGDGLDIASYNSSASYGVNVSLASPSGETFVSIEGLEGSAFNDTLSGDAGDNVLRGLLYNDTMAGGAGNDQYEVYAAGASAAINTDTISESGASGEDTIFIGGAASFDGITFARSGSNLTIGHATGSVTIIGQTVSASQIEYIELDSGAVASLANLRVGAEAATTLDDFMVGTSGNDTRTGLDGNDVLVGGDGVDKLEGGAGDDWLEGGLGNDSVASAGLLGGDGKDTLVGGAGIDSVNGDAGDDLIYADWDGAGDSLDGGANTDGVSYRNFQSAVSADLSSAAVGSYVSIMGDAVRNVENISGSSYNDTLTGNAVDNILTGEAGNDLLTGNAGNDALTGQDGLDSLGGGDGNDVIYGGSHKDQLTGDAGLDTLSGDDGDDVVDGGNDNDIVMGGLGADTLSGSYGDDIMLGGVGNDSLSGQAGNDTYSFTAEDDADIITDNSGEANAIVLSNVTADQIWMVREGANLKISVIGGTSVITVKDFYASTNKTKIKFIDLGIQTLFLDFAKPLVDSMTSVSPSSPSVMPDSLVEVLDDYWLNSNAPSPVVEDISVETLEDVAVSGSLNIIDYDGDLVSAAVSTAPQFGVVVLTGTLTWQYTPNANANGTDVFVVEVTDAAGNKAYKTVKVVVNAVDDRATFTGTPSFTVAENSATGTVVGTVVATDIDSPATFTYSLVANTSYFTIDATTGQLKLSSTGPDFERTPKRVITVRATDANGNYTDRLYTVNVTNVNEAPVNIASTLTSVNENIAPGTVLGQLTAFDPEGGPITYSAVTTGSGFFEVSASGVVTLAAGATADYEYALFRGFTARATDSGGLSKDVSFYVYINDVNEAPNQAVSYGLAVKEGAALGTVVGTVYARDVDFDVLTYSLVDDATSPFTVNASTGVVTVDGTISGLTTRTINVRATDSSGLYTDKTLSIPVSAAGATNPGPVFSGASSVTIPEHSVGGTLLATMAATDSDGGVTYSLSYNYGNLFAINTSSGALTLAGAATPVSGIGYEAGPLRTIVVRATDALGNYTDRIFTVNLTNINEAVQSINATPLVVAENSAVDTVVGSVLGFDNDGGTLNYTLVSNDSNRFAIGLTTGVIKVATASLDFESGAFRNIIVRATDSGGLTKDVTVTVKITDVNEAPSVSTATPLSVAENATVGTVVGMIYSADPEGLGTLTYTLTNNAGGLFDFNASTGELRVASTAINFEAGSSQSVTLQVKDLSGTGLVTDKTFTVAILDQSEAPVITTSSFSVTENASAGSVIGTLAGSDPEGTALTYSLVRNVSNWFGVAANGQVTVAGPVDYEQGSTQTITVRATDTAGSYTDKSITINVGNVAEAPVITSSEFTIPENMPVGQAPFGTVQISDQDAASLNYSIVGGDSAMFSISQTTGQLTLQGMANYEARTSYSIDVRIQEVGATGNNLSHTKTIKVNVTDVDDKPTTDFSSINRGNYDNFLVISAASVINPSSPVNVYVDRYITEGGYSSIPGMYYPDVPIAIGSGYELQVSQTRDANWGIYDTYSYKIKLRVEDSWGNRTYQWVDAGFDGWNATAIVTEASSPIVLDLDNDGLELTDMSGNTTFDMNNDGVRDRTGWIGSGDGLLVIDRNHNDKIDSVEEISYVADRPNATSDLEGMTAYDSNNNGAFDRGDSRWGEFQVWRDANRDGVSQAGELVSLNDLSIASISLTRQLTGNIDNGGNLITATSTLTLDNGQARTVGDVMLSYEVYNSSITRPDTTDLPTDAEVLAGLQNANRNVSSSQKKAAIERRNRSRGSIQVQDLRESMAAFGQQQDHRAAVAASQVRQAPRTGFQAGSPVLDVVRAADTGLGRDIDGLLAAATAPSAMNDSLATQQTFRIKMVEAMAAFMPNSGYSGMMKRDHLDPEAQMLLTSLPLKRESLNA